MLLKNRNFGQKSECFQEIEILAKKSKFQSKIEFWSGIQMFVSSSILYKIRSHIRELFPNISMRD